MKILDVKWFCGRMNVGIVRVDNEWDGIKYYIGSFDPTTEERDAEFIADWGSTFPSDVGDILFGVDPIRNGEAVQVPQNEEQARLMIAVAYNYLGIKE